MSFKRKFLRNAMRDDIKERQRTWRKGKYESYSRQVRETISSKVKKER